MFLLFKGELVESMESKVRSDGMCISWNRKEGIGGKERKDRKKLGVVESVEYKLE